MERPSKKMKVFPRFTLPFHHNPDGIAASPLSRAEMAAFNISTAIRCKPRWYEKINNATIVNKWKKELGITGDEEEERTDRYSYYRDEDKISAQDFESILSELIGIADRRAGSIIMSPVDGVYEADGLIPDDLKNALIQGVSVLENVPDEEKDWHPGSHRQVLDLVHPSLYCLVNGVSMKRTESDQELINEIKSEGPFSLKHVGQGEPVEFHHDLSSQVDDERVYDAYGNELDDVHKVAPNYCVSDKYQWLPSEFLVNDDGTVNIETYINNLHPEQHKQLYTTIGQVFEKFVPLFNTTLSAELSGHRLQVIVKLANIVLTPDNPEYKGGSWHVEGMYNEKIVASGIYYYTCDNITESRLAFREAVYEPDEYEKEQYGYYYGDTLNQERGELITQQDRCIVFQNHMQHCVQPFRLADPTKPGVRKILVFFLVDPNERICSTLHIPPQQRSWYLPIAKQIQLVPDEIIEQIVEYMNLPMSLEDAKNYRAELMDERRFFVQENNTVVFERPCSLCEH